MQTKKKVSFQKSSFAEQPEGGNDKMNAKKKMGASNDRTAPNEINSSLDDYKENDLA
jgi:hypothetical protein